MNNTNKASKHVVEYSTAKGVCFGDHEVEAAALRFLAGPDRKIVVTSGNFILACRVLIKRRVIPHTSIVFLFQGEELHPNYDARLDNWPAGFCTFEDRCLDVLLS